MNQIKDVVQTVESKWHDWRNENWQVKCFFSIFERILSLYQNTIIFDQFCYHSYVINWCLRHSFVIYPSSFSHFLSFIICECIPEFFIHYFRLFLVFVLMIHLFFRSLGEQCCQMYGKVCINTDFWYDTDFYTEICQWYGNSKIIWN